MKFRQEKKAESGEKQPLWAEMCGGVFTSVVSQSVGAALQCLKHENLCGDALSEKKKKKICLSPPSPSAAECDVLYLLWPHPLTTAVHPHPDSDGNRGGPGDPVRGGAGRHAAVCVWRQRLLFQ